MLKTDHQYNLINFFYNFFYQYLAINEKIAKKAECYFNTRFWAFPVMIKTMLIFLLFYGPKTPTKIHMWIKY